ncbi:molybdopterin converting factor subunit 1 [Virgibacillus sp. C22-A2]|uniref:Molybdopterin synthase sulfur carrier subunit n=1 Tax=Virgibacillus tibetensis TaxID=3042313 RepID=A0ABU6KJM2_9BACI|nr:molybdopterin converting factor subunit 1 [Virgibacillus sp. C22-A2]
MIKVLLFAHLTEEAGKDSIEVETDEISVNDLKKILQEKHNIKQLDHVMTAINEEYATNDDKVKSGDIVALIPPVSGG